MNERIVNHEDNATVGRSGNSDVDINIDIDTTAIAYAMLCSLYATDRLNRREFDLAVNNFDSIMEKKQKIKNSNDGLSRPKLYGVSNNTRKRNWI